MTISLDEHVARAITAIAYPQSPWDDKDCCTPSMKKHALRKARAAIAAVREYEVAKPACPCGIRPENFTICSAGTCGVCQAARAIYPSIRESERAACEAIADEEVDRCTREGRSELAAFRIRDALAARKGKGEVPKP
jgi:hypothetical protein